jgi:hypothetical protein
MKIFGYRHIVSCKEIKKTLLELCIAMLITISFLFPEDRVFPRTIGVSAQWQSYESFSQQMTGFPMRAGYPVLKTQSFSLGLTYQDTKNQLQADVSFPAAMTSDNGTGENLILNAEESHYLRAGLEYSHYFPLFRSGRFTGRHAFHAGILYEDRFLHYLSDRKESTQDLNAFIGPRLALHVDLPQQWEGFFCFDARFYPPFMNIGTLTDYSEINTPVFSTPYFAFYYQTVFHAGISRHFNERLALRIGVKRNDLVGFANSRLLFYPDDIVHFKLDRLYHAYIEMDFRLKGDKDEK